MTTTEAREPADTAVSREPAVPPKPGHAEELDEIAELGDALRAEGD
jgi:hypothetical protein